VQGVGKISLAVVDAPGEESGDIKHKFSSLPIKRFSVNNNTSYNSFISFKNSLAELVQAVVLQCGSESSASDAEMMQGLLDLDFVYDLLPPEILQPEPTPEWFINFLNSDREPAIQPDEIVDPPLSHEGETWEKYCTRNNLVEEEPLSDNESIAQSTTSNMSIDLESQFQPNQETGTSEPQFEFDLTSNEWQTRWKMVAQGLKGAPQSETMLETEKLLKLIPTYFRPKTSIRDVHAEFPLPKHLYNLWKDGVILWPQCKYAKDVRKGPTDPVHLAIMNRLVEAGICEVTVSSPFTSSMFYIVNSKKTSLRPIFNYGHMTKHFTTPHFNLPSLYRVLEKYSWKPNMYYAKLDFSQAFFNINLHEKSKHVTNIKLGKTYYRFNYMPFRMSLAPFVCQQILNSIMKYIRKTIVCAWGHIDDILLAHENHAKHVLQNNRF